MARKNKYVCIHGHFYQPPRENAWLETVELQESAQPFHDWNERINFECYAPNTAARLMDGDQFITKITNNYTYINFNFGPTLLSWMKSADPLTHERIVEADRVSQEKFGGHGSAIAQVHSHLIMPLANERDKETQVIWGIRDFESRFNRYPEGMWLAETAADTDTLEVLAKHGIKYTILAPQQAKAFRKIGDHDWKNKDQHGFDVRRPYKVNLPSGRSMALFFYDGNVAQDVAFNKLLNNGQALANRLMEPFDNNDEPQLSHIATDGESYGHHHRYGEMALASCLDQFKTNKVDATLINYGYYLELFPPEYEAQIHDNSSWSCVHGVERWRNDCGCNTGGNHGWTQSWRTELRDSLNWLRDEIIPIYEEEAGKLLRDPWAARNDFIEVLLDRNDKVVDKFLKKHQKHKLKPEEKVQAMRLLEMQRNAVLMFSSCGWFFDEISGLETNQILQYACRVLYYAKQVGGVDLNGGFVHRLSKAKSNVYADGAFSYINHVLPTTVNLEGAGIHYAVASLFEQQPEEMELFNYHAKSEYFKRETAGKLILNFGRTIMKSKVTYSEKPFNFVVLYLGQQNIISSVSLDISKERFMEMEERISKAFHANQLGDVIAIMHEYFGRETFSFQHLFRDEKRKILKKITKQNLSKAEKSFRNIYNDNYQLMSSTLQSGIPIPKAYNNVVQYIVNADLHRFFTFDNLSISELKRLSAELEKWDIQLNNSESFKLAAGERIFYEIRKIENADIPIEELRLLIEILETLHAMGLDPNIWKSQNLYAKIHREYRKSNRAFPNSEWKKKFIELGYLLKYRREIPVLSKA